MTRHCYVVAHPDDDLVFMSPTLLDLLRARTPVQTIYLTAGDAGRNSKYWSARERGIVAAYAAATERRPADFVVSSAESIQRYATLDQQVALAFLRLPDGMLDGQGSPLYGDESLGHLWEGGRATLGTVDGQARYTRQELCTVIATNMSQFAPDVVHTLNPGPLSGGEHADHRSAAAFAQAAWQCLVPRPDIRFYVGSNSVELPANVEGGPLRYKQKIFRTYAAFDSAIARTGSIYEPMLAREYTVDGNFPVESAQGVTI